MTYSRCAICPMRVKLPGLCIAVFRGHAGQPADVRQVQGLRDAWSFGTAAFPKCIPDRLSLCWRPNEGKAGWSLGIAVFRGGLPDKLPLCGRPIHSCHLPISVLTWTGTGLSRSGHRCGSTREKVGQRSKKPGTCRVQSQGEKNGKAKESSGRCHLYSCRRFAFSFVLCFCPEI